MKLYTLKRFETYTYSTHTVFIATSYEKACELCAKFYDDYFNLYQAYLIADHERNEYYEEHGNFDCAELNQRCWEFEVKYNPQLFDAFGFNSGQAREELITEWVNEIQEIEGNSIFMVSDTDGD